VSRLGLGSDGGALVAGTAEELGHLGLHSSLDQQSGAKTGDILQHLDQVPPSSEQAVDLGADAIGGRYSTGHGRGSSFVSLRGFEGNLRPSSFTPVPGRDQDDAVIGKGIIFPVASSMTWSTRRSTRACCPQHLSISASNCRPRFLSSVRTRSCFDLTRHVRVSCVPRCPQPGWVAAEVQHLGNLVEGAMETYLGDQCAFGIVVGRLQRSAAQNFCPHNPVESSPPWRTSMSRKRSRPRGGVRSGLLDDDVCGLPPHPG
jgi:hypothetical protein